MGLSPSVRTLQIILPVGISFYTFQTLSYTIDIYKKKLNPESNFFVFASYVAFFPQLVAGPIVRAIDLLPQFKLNHKITSEQIRRGIFLIILGYFKKIVIADSLAPLVDDAFANPLNYTSLNMSIVVFFYSFQIYCDFSGYSDIAIGLGKMLGFNFPINFNLPYLSKNFSDFWKRWHISLSSWLRDYLYIPLGGNRKGSIITQRNLILTMLLGGLWHGANWTFVVWGLLHGAFLIIQGVFKPVFSFLDRNLPKSLITVLGIIVTFLLVNIAWIFFRSQTISDAFDIIGKISSFDDMSFSALKPKFQIFKAFLIITILFLGEISYYLFENKIDSILRKKKFPQLFINAFLIWMILLFGTYTNNNFIYFQF
jgi:D-alanyl-lipoteichoic acid acyltransferase DltB (MBOAT superfamily)